MTKSLTLALTAATLLAACAQTPQREAPHHYSTARDGSRIACYTSQVPTEYECVPLRPAYGNPFYEDYGPGMSLGWYYGWPASMAPGYYPPYPYPLYAPPRPPRHFEPRR